MKRPNWASLFVIGFACIFAFPFSADAQKSLEPRTAQPLVTKPSPSTKGPSADAALAVHVCDRLVKLNEQARTINRSLSEYLKLGDEMNGINVQSQVQLTQATKEPLPQGKPVAPTTGKAPVGQIVGAVPKERVVNQSPEIRKMRQIQGDSLRLKNQIVGDLRALRQEVSSVVSDLAKLPGGGLVPAEHKQCIRRATAQFEGEISQMNRNTHSLKPKPGAQSLNSRPGSCDSCDEARCLDCCRNLYRIDAAPGSPLHAQQERRQMLCISHCVILHESCRRSSDQSDMYGMAMDILKSVSDSSADMTRKLSNI